MRGETSSRICNRVQFLLNSAFIKKRKKTEKQSKQDLQLLFSFLNNLSIQSTFWFTETKQVILSDLQHPKDTDIQYAIRSSSKISDM